MDINKKIGCIISDLQYSIYIFGAVVTITFRLGTHRRNGVNYEWYQDSGLPLVKRRLAAAAEELLSRDCHLEPDRSRGVFKGYFAGSPPPGVLSRVDAR